LSTENLFAKLTEAFSRIGLSAEAESIADALWFAQFQPTPLTRERRAVAELVAPGPDSTNLPAPGSQLPPLKPDKPSITQRGAEQPPPGWIFPGSYGSSSLGRRASPINVPAASALPGELDIARAFRPFSRRLPAFHRLAVDEEATAESIAHFGFVRPVLKPVLERWFDVALVVDGSGSMDVWRKTIEEFELLLARHGAFGQVKRWRLSGEPEIHLESLGGRKIAPSNLGDSRGRTLVLVATNGVAAFWNRDEMARVLSTWSRRAPVAIVQLFSESLWPHTNLGGPSRYVRAKLPGAVNSKFDIERKRWEHRSPNDNLTAIPILSFEPQSIVRWAEACMAMGVRSTPAVVFARETPGSEGEVGVPDPKSIDSIARIEHFRTFASKEAFRLACYLAAVPLTLPVMRIVQQQLSPSPRVEHLAEVMASGLLERLTPADPRMDPDMVVYSFPEEIGSLLRSALPVGRILDVRAHVQAKLKDFIERQIGCSIASFRAFVLDGQGTYSLPTDAQAFVEIERSLLKKLGIWSRSWILQKVRHFLDQPGNLRRIAWSADAALLASGGYDGVIRIRDAESGVQVQNLSAHTDVVYAVSWSPDSTMLASGSRDGTVRIWSRDTGRLIRILECGEDGVLGLGWSPDGKSLVCGTNSGALIIWSPIAGILQTKILRHQGAVHTVAWSPDGSLIASASNDGLVGRFSPDRSNEPDAQTGLTGHEGQVYGVAWSPDGATLASAGANGTIIIWNQAGSEVVRLLGHTGAVTDLCFSADGAFLASISWDDTVRIWNIRDRSQISVLPIKSAQRFHSGVAFHPSLGHSIAFVTERASVIEVWQPVGEQVLQPIKEYVNQRLLNVLISIGLNQEKALEAMNKGPAELGDEIIKLAPDQTAVFQYYLRVIQAFANSDWNQLLLLHDEKLIVVAEEIEPNKKRYRYGASAANWAGIIGRAARTRTVVWVPDVDREPDYIAAVPSTAAEFAVPLLSSDGSSLLGVINVELAKPHALSESQRSWLIQFSRHFANTIENRNAHVYISYDLQDESIASTLAHDLKEAGFLPWLSLKQLQAGEQVVESIAAAIQNSGVFAVLLSNKVTSNWLRGEMRLARAHHPAIRILALVTENVHHLGLAQFNIIDFRNGYESGLRALLEALRSKELVPSSEGEFTSLAIANRFQLPTPPADFTGREAELRDLRGAIEKDGIRIAALTGQGGVGKTALAIKLAVELTPNFPDAQIYLDLKGTTEKPLTTAEGLAHVIRAFHPETRLPDKEAELYALFRSVLDDKRAVLLMDNARDGTQVQSLIPPERCVLLLTSRTQLMLPGLYQKNLDTLPPEDATGLLLRIAPRIGGEAETIARLCGYLPEALRLAATAIAERTDLTPTQFLHRLTDEKQRLGFLTGEYRVDASIALTYNLLDDGTQERWRALSVFLDTFDAPAATAVWEAELDTATETLSRLVRYSILEWNDATRRYRLQDLIRDFARQALSAQELSRAAIRYSTYYGAILARAEDLYLKGGDAVAQALALFDIERRNIEGGQMWAAANLATNRATAELCSSYPDWGAEVLFLRQHPREQILWREAALAAARQLRDPHAEGRHLASLGVAYASLGEYDRAVEYNENALIIYRKTADRVGEAGALGNLGFAYNALGNHRRSIEYNEQALVIDREIRNLRGETYALGNLGTAYTSLGEHNRALEYYEKKLAIDREIGNRQGEVNALAGLGIVFSKLGEFRRAIEYYERQLHIAREIGDRRGEGGALANIGVALENLGDRKKAIEHAELGLSILEQIEDPSSGTVKKQLDGWKGSYASFSTEDLLEACFEAKNEFAWEEFVNRFNRSITLSVVRTARRWGDPTKSVIEDLVQETLLKLFANEGRLLRVFAREHPDQVLGYIKTIATNVTHDHFRSMTTRKRGAQLEGIEDVDVEADHLSILDKNVTLEQIDKLLADVTSADDREKQRTIFWLHYSDGLSAKSIAALPSIGLKPKQVENIIRNLTSKIRDHLRRTDDAKPIGESQSKPNTSRKQNKKKKKK